MGPTPGVGRASSDLAPSAQSQDRRLSGQGKGGGAHNRRPTVGAGEGLGSPAPEGAGRSSLGREGGRMSVDRGGWRSADGGGADPARWISNAPRRESHSADGDLGQLGSLPGRGAGDGVSDRRASGDRRGQGDRRFSLERRGSAGRRGSVGRWCVRVLC
jgi:hypothetical protein